MAPLLRRSSNQRQLGALFFRRQARHAHRVQATAVGAQYAEAEAVELHRLAAFGQMAEARYDETTDGIEFLVREMRAENLVEVIDLGCGLHAEHALLLADDVVFDFVE